MDLTSIPAVLPHDGLLIRRVLKKVAVLCARTKQLTGLGVGDKAGEDENRDPSNACIVDAMSKSLGANVNMNDDGLWLSRDSGISISHGDGNDLRRASEDPRPCIRPLSLALDDCLDDGGVVGADIDKARSDSGLMEW